MKLFLQFLKPPVKELLSYRHALTLRFVKAVKDHKPAGKSSAAKASEFSKARGSNSGYANWEREPKTKGLLRQETGLWPQHRAVWDWKNALGLAEEKRDYVIHARRKYKVSPYSEGLYFKTLESWFQKLLSSLCQPDQHAWEMWA